MARRDSTAGMLCCPIGLRERIACDDMRAQLAIDSDANLVRSAMHFYAEFVLGKGAVDVNLFGLQTRREHAKKRVRRPVAAKFQRQLFSDSRRVS
jgi:hypothetical protein